MKVVVEKCSNVGDLGNADKKKMKQKGTMHSTILFWVKYFSWRTG